MAKDRSRRRRIVLLAGLVVVFVGFGWVSFESWKVWRGNPNPTVDSREELRLLAERAGDVSRPEGEAAWFQLMKVLDGADSVSDEIEILHTLGGPFIPPDAYDREPLRRAVSRLKEMYVLQNWARFAAGPPGVIQDRGSGRLTVDDTVQQLARFRSLAHTGGAVMRLAAVEGDGPAAAAAFDQLLALSRTLANQGQFLPYLTGAAIESLAFGAIRTELLDVTFDEATYLALLEILERHRFTPIAVVLEAERIAFLDQIQWSYSDDGTGDGYMVALPFVQAGQAPLHVGFIGAAASRFIHPTRRELSEAFASFMDKLIEITGLPQAERVEPLADLEIAMESGPRRERMVNLMAGPLCSVVRQEIARTTRRESNRVIIALELFRARSGRYPESLDELVPHVLAETPLDPLHGLPFGYRRLANDPKGRPFLLYSIGLDRSDDGGTTASAAAIDDHGWAAVLFVPQVRGDLVLNTYER